MISEDEMQELNKEDKDLCKTCEHYWQDFPIPCDTVISHCEIIDEKYGMLTAGRKHLMDELVQYPCDVCPFNSYQKNEKLEITVLASFSYICIKINK